MSDLENIPQELQQSSTFLPWQYIENGSKRRKVPVSEDGQPVAYNNENALMSFPEIQRICAENSDYSCGISLLEGLEIQVDSEEGYLWCLDFDGFRSPEGKLSEPLLTRIFQAVPGYVEISPSGTGFKYFFVSKRKPTNKLRIKFGASCFSQDYPEIRKYQHSEIEVFSKGLFLALTGAVLDPRFSTLKFVEDTQFNQLLELLEKWAKKSGGPGNEISSTITQSTSRKKPPKNPKKLKEESLELVLSYIDNHDEQIWTDISNALARVYQESGQSYFLKFSSGEYSRKPYPNYDEGECIARYQRALNECESKPEGYRISYIEKLAMEHPKWPDHRLEYEDGLSPSSVIWGPPRLITQSEFNEITRSGYADYEANPTTEGTPYTFLTPNQLRNLPATKWRIKGLFPDKGLGSIYGPPGSGKTFLAFQLTTAVAYGDPFMDIRRFNAPWYMLLLKAPEGLQKE